MAASGQTATTKAMGEGSTQHQHLIQTELPTKTLLSWVEQWGEFNAIEGPFKVQLRPHTPTSEILELKVFGPNGDVFANTVFSHMFDRRGTSILSVRDQHTYDPARRKRLSVLLHLFLIKRYGASAIHYLTPTEDNIHQAASMKTLGIFTSTSEEVGDILVADIDADRVDALVAADSAERGKLIRKES
jgi:isocitrate lyase